MNDDVYGALVFDLGSSADTSKMHTSQKSDACSMPSLMRNKLSDLISR